jgi:hypothetical protein
MTLLLWFVHPAIHDASAQHPNYQATAGYLEVLSAISVLEKDTTKIDESTKAKLLAEGRALQQLEESYADGSQPLIKRFAAAEKTSEALESEFERLDARRKQIAADEKRTQLQVDTFNTWKDDYNARATNHNKMFDQLAELVNAENKRLEEKYLAFASRVKSQINPPALEIMKTVQSMVESKKYEADENGTKCSHFVADYAKELYDYDGFHQQNSDGTTKPIAANAIIKKMQDGDEWEKLYDDPEWLDSKKPLLQAAFNKAAQYAGDGDLVIVGFKSGDPDEQSDHVAIVQNGATEGGSITWINAGIDGLEFPRIAQAGKEVFASKKLTFGITADDLKTYGMVIYVFKH